MDEVVESCFELREDTNVLRLRDAASSACGQCKLNDSSLVKSLQNLVTEVRSIAIVHEQ